MSDESATSATIVLSKHYEKVTTSIVNSFDELEAALAIPPDMVFLGMKFVPDPAHMTSKLWVSDYLDARHIVYTGSPKTSHVLESNKELAKQRMIENGLQTAPFLVIKEHDERIAGDMTLRFPLFVKPTDKGGGQGIDERSIVRTLDELYEKVASIRDRLKTDALVEEYLDGREFSVAVIRIHGSDELIAMPIELIADKDGNGERMLSNHVKNSNNEGVLAVNNLAERSRIITLAIDAFRALGARDYGRIDIRLDSQGIAHFLEANLIPSLTKDYGSFPKAYQLNEGIDYDEMIMNIVRLAASRQPASL